MENEVLTQSQVYVEQIKNDIDNFLTICTEGKEIDKISAKKIASLPHRLSLRLAEIYRQKMTMATNEALALPPKMIHRLYLDYLSIIVYINQSIPYNANKSEFLSFARINVDDFARLLDSGTDEQKKICVDIDGDLANLTLSAAEQGQLKEGSSRIRLKAKGGFGHSLTEIGDAESVIDKMQGNIDNNQLRYEFQNLIEMKKRIDKK